MGRGFSTGYYGYARGCSSHGPTLDSFPMDRRLAVAIEAAKAAGEVALRYFRTGLTVELKGDGSPVTRADRECEQCIVEVLRGAFPDYALVGEEFGERPGVTDVGATGACAKWIID